VDILAMGIAVARFSLRQLGFLVSGLTSRILTCTELKGHCFVCFSFWLRVLD